MTPHGKWPVAIIGSGDVGADLAAKIHNSDGPLSVVALADNDIRAIFDARTLLEEAGRRGMVGGQEDMLVDIALDLSSGQ